MNMSRNNTSEADDSQSSDIELSTGTTTNTQMFLETCVLDADHKALEEYLGNNPVQQSDLDRSLLRGLQNVQRKERELSHVAQALTLLLQYGAKWNSDDLLNEQKTPYHIICESPGDHHELLDLMIKSSQPITIDTRDSSRSTALLHAVQNANINCLKCLIANGADVNIETDRYQYSVTGVRRLESRPIVQLIMMMRSGTNHSSVNEDIFDLLLHKSPIESYTPLIVCAIAHRSFFCVKKLIENGARLEITVNNEHCVWARIAYLGDVDLLNCMLKHGIDKNVTDQNGLCVLWYVVDGCKIDAVRHLLELGVTIPTCEPEVSERQCEQCKENTFIINDLKWENQVKQDPCLRAICYDDWEIVKLLEEYGSKSCTSFNALRRAVVYDSAEVALYLLNKYKYPLNIEYTKESDPSGSTYTLLTEPRLFTSYEYRVMITKLLLDHGADPAKQMCSGTSVNAVMSAIVDGNLGVIAQYIRSGVNINVRSYDRSYGKVLPLEASVLRGYHDVTEMLLISGCSCGVYSLKNNHEFKNNLRPEVKELMKEWQVQENNVTPLKQRCRSVILNHLSPRADIKIKKLLLP